MAVTMTGVRLYLWRAIQGHPTAAVDGEHGFDVLPRHEVVGLRAALRSGPTPRPMPLNETTAAGAQRPACVRGFWAARSRGRCHRQWAIVWARYGEHPDLDEVCADVTGVMQEALARLAAERRFPVVG